MVSSAQTFSLLLAPAMEDTVELMQTFAFSLLGVNPDTWGEPAQRDGLWVSEAAISGTGDEAPQMARLSLKEGAQGWLLLTGFVGGGELRWVFSDPPKLELSGLSEADLDSVWQLARAEQASALQAWVRKSSPEPPKAASSAARRSWRGLVKKLVREGGSRMAAPLPRVAQPLFAPEDFPRWLYQGELSSLPRHMLAANAYVAGVASDATPGSRLLVRPVHRMGEQCVVPVMMMSRGARFVGAMGLKTFPKARDLLDALLEVMTRFTGRSMGPPKKLRVRDSAPQVVYLSRWWQLEQSELQPFSERVGAARYSGGQGLRFVQVSTDYPVSGYASAKLTVEIFGLSEGGHLFVTAERLPEGPYRVRYFCVGPQSLGEDLKVLLGQHL